ncbi:hypothetical protein [Paenibacillus sp. HJGM_3]|uniref:hypothetical protein n=1 Tax=Paenibacillus sp. HJGM_3 TaxID=3379816 RepID=UPI00385F3BEA
MSRAAYLAYIEKAVANGRETFGEHMSNWKQAYKPDQFLGMYTAPGIIPVQVQLEGFMYSITGNLDYAEHAKRLLLEADTYTSIVPEEHRRRHPEYAKGVPVVEAMFQAPHFLYGYLHIKDSGVVTPEERARIEQSIRCSVDSLFHYPEWGAHNRSMLRVWTLSLAIEALGDTEETRTWDKMRRYLAEESIGKWSIEDAQLYLILWLVACQEYALYSGQELTYFRLPQTKYYYDYLLRIVTPQGFVPDYGDSHYGSNWYLWAACLEKGAAVYRDGHMKYAAQKVFEHGMALTGDTVSIGLAAYLTYAYMWANDEVQPVRPDWGTEELLEDVVGKKIIFRDGWNEEDAYMLLSYRDEGQYAFTPRHYLRNTISVKAEKAHHGHSDENAVSCLVKDGNILLHDGGYREQLPNGKYRNDIYHNRLVFRTGAIPDGSSVYDFLHDQGHYKQAITEKIHMQTFARLEYSRTRMYDMATKTTWDRNITYIKEDGVFIIVDWTKADADLTVTTANLWHTGSAEELGERSFDTFVRHVHRGPGDQNPYLNRSEWALAIEFPGSGRLIGREPIKRAYGEAVMLYETESASLRQGEMRAYVTVLTPHRRSVPAPEVTGRVAVERLSDRADMISLTYRGSSAIHLAYKLDLEHGLLDPAAYPRYTWVDSKVEYGRVTTDADFAYVIEDSAELQYGFLNGFRLEFDGEVLFETPKLSSYQFETQQWRIVDHKWRAWDGAKSLPR